MKGRERKAKKQRINKIWKKQRAKPVKKNKINPLKRGAPKFERRNGLCFLFCFRAFLCVVRSRDSMEASKKKKKKKKKTTFGTCWLPLQFLCSHLSGQKDTQTLHTLSACFFFHLLYNALRWRASSPFCFHTLSGQQHRSYIIPLAFRCRPPSRLIHYLPLHFLGLHLLG